MRGEGTVDNRDEHEPDLEGDAALYAAGALPADEAARFEERLRTCEAAREALAGYGPLLEAMYRAAVPCPPSPGPRDALLRRVAAPAVLPPGVSLHRGEEAAWEKTPFPGVLRRWLHREGRQKSYLLRMAPGAVLPAHPHPADEQCLVLEGEASTFGVLMRPGDYFRARAGTQHGETVTEGGCLLLLHYTAAEA